MEHLTRTQFGNPILRQRATRVPLAFLQTKAAKTLLQNMFYTIEKIGVGLAAPQVGLPYQLAVIHVRPLPHRPRVERYKRVIVNPKIIRASTKQQHAFEGCLSCDGLRGEVPRAQWVDVVYWDETGVKHEERAEGFLATVFQHEIDHLNGILYVDRMKGMRTLMTTEEFRRQQ